MKHSIKHSEFVFSHSAFDCLRAAPSGLRTRPGGPRKLAARIGGMLLVCGLSLGPVACPGGKTEAPEVSIHEGELLSPRGKNFTYVRGDVSNAKTVAIDYLQGDVRGEKIRNLWINFMEGTVANGPVTINILKGNIIEGDGVTVNLLIGEDFSGEALVGKKIEPPLTDESAHSK